MRGDRFLLLITVVTATAMVSLSAAQRAGAPASAKPRGPGFLERSAIFYGTGEEALTPAERAIVEARFAEYERLFTAADSVARPQGFIVKPSVSGGAMTRSRRIPSFRYALMIAPLVQERLAAIFASENPESSSVWSGGGGPANFRDSAGDIYSERQRSGPLPGMLPTTYVFDGLQFDKPTRARSNAVRVLLTPDGVLPWTDVPRERVLNILIAEAEDTYKKTAQLTAETVYQRWLREAPERQRTREQLVVTLTATAGMDKPKAEKMKADMERADREVGESYKKADAEERERNIRNLALLKERVAYVRAQQTAMSATERAMPAWFRLNSDGHYSFASPGTPGFERLIADKPDFYRFKGSRVQVRTLMVYFHIQEYPREEAEDRAVIDAYKAFDWAAAQRMLTPLSK